MASPPKPPSTTDHGLQKLGLHGTSHFARHPLPQSAYEGQFQVNPPLPNGLPPHEGPRSWGNEDARDQEAYEMQLQLLEEQNKKRLKAAFDEQNAIQQTVDIEKQCGVLKDGKPCGGPLSCKRHSMTAKRNVRGRSKPFDQLLQDHQNKVRDVEVGRGEEPQVGQ